MEAFVESMMEKLGPFGIGPLMFLEKVFPPIPSKLIMPLVGYLATRGGMNIAIVIAAGTLGSLVGTLPWYYLGKRLGHAGVRRFAARHGRWLTMHPSDVDAASERFKRHGNASVLVGRLIPTVRTLISVPAGVADGPVPSLSTVGTFVWDDGVGDGGLSARPGLRDGV
jgi:membrane protein DedA with SNARE-associated domain